jgi:hypothetical protein
VPRCKSSDPHIKERINMLFSADVKSDLNWKDMKPSKKELKECMKMAIREVKEWEKFIKLVRKQMEEK